MNRNAVVLSGGGASGAFEVGVLKALVEGASPATGRTPLDPAVLTGTSVGAFNAAVFVSHQGPPAAAVAALERLWLERIADAAAGSGNGIYRMRGVPLQSPDHGWAARPIASLSGLARDAAFLTGLGWRKGAEFLSARNNLEGRLLTLVDMSALFSEDPLRGLLHQAIDVAAIRKSPRVLAVAASNWQSGTLRLFDNRDVSRDAIRASTAIPGIFQPVPVDGVPYADGAVLLCHPLEPALDAGADTLHVIYSDPRIEHIPLADLPSSIETLHRMFAIQWAASVVRDIARAERSHRTQGRTQGRTHRPLTIHRYRPDDDLGGGIGLLDFRGARLAALIRQGYETAAHHDCAAAECVVA